MNGLSKGLACGVLASTVAFAAVAQDGGVTFTDIADGGGAGVTYERVPSPRAEIRNDVIRNAPYLPANYFPTVRPNTPQKGRGAPGVVIFDYDRDGDQDLYVPNGPGAANSLYDNQFDSTGTVSFIDVGAASGAGAADQDSSGVCFGDIDNDGDEDLYVLGTGEPNRLFENNGNGTFNDITATAGVGGGDRYPVACSFADFDNDGLLDVVVGNSYDDWDNRQPVFVAGPTYPFFEHNQLFRNLGGNVFEDRSAAAGIENVSNLTGVPGTSGAAFTWAIGTADYDRDGDVDIFSMDNQGGAPVNPEDLRGWIRLYNNDGTGNFTETTIDAGLNVQGGWMGVGFEDFDCNGTIDFFASDLGSYLAGAPSRPFMNNGDGTFADVGIGALERTPFGWGVDTFDYDNDGDGDVIFHGGVDILSFLIADNPGTLLTNDGACSGTFSYDAGAVLKNHVFRMVQGVATGDLNNDGFEDIVTVSQSDENEPVNPLSFLIFNPPSNAPFDSLAMVELVFSTLQVPGMVVYAGNLDENGDPINPDNGTVTVEMNSADNGNNSVAFDLLGSAGIVHPRPFIEGSPVNRDGIGAVVSFTPKDGFTRTKPVDGGSSYASQSSVVANFGLGAAHRGQVDVEWPGGIANRLHHVWNGEQVTLPYIPCDAQADDARFGRYARCVGRSLRDYRRAGEIGFFASFRHKISAFRFFFEEQFGL